MFLDGKLRYYMNVKLPNDPFNDDKSDWQIIMNAGVAFGILALLMLILRAFRVI